MKYRTIIGAATAILVPALALGQATHSVGTANTTLGILKLFGSTSGDVSVKPAAVAGTSTVFQLPATNGSNGEFLQTNGSGVTSWQTATGSGTVNSGTAGQLAYYATSTSAVSGDANATISTGALTLGASGTVGSLAMGNGTSGTLKIQTPATGALGSAVLTLPIGTTDFSGTSGVIQQATTGAAFTVGTVSPAQLAPSTFATGTTHSLGTGGLAREYWECTATCTVTPPTPAAGYEFCVRNANAATGVITLAAVTSVLYEKTDYTAYGTATTAATSGGALGDKICIVGKDSTHYDVFSFNGTWTMN